MVKFRKFRYEEKELKIIHNSTLIGLSFFFFFLLILVQKDLHLLSIPLRVYQRACSVKPKPIVIYQINQFSSTLPYALGEHQIKHTLKNPSLLNCLQAADFQRVFISQRGFAQTPIGLPSKGISRTQVFRCLGSFLRCLSPSVQIASQFSLFTFYQVSKSSSLQQKSSLIAVLH